MRDRLIELLIKSGVTWNPCGVADHLLDNGVIALPCAVGDTVYIIENPYTLLPLKKVVEGDVLSLHLYEDRLFLRVLFDTKKIKGCVDYNTSWGLNKTVFLTKEEAEKALAERSEVNNG